MIGKNVFGMLLTLPFSVTLFAQTSALMPPIQAIVGVVPQADVFDDASRTNPLVLCSAQEAAQYFAPKEISKLEESVDFQKQHVLVFAWRGSGQDRLQYVVLESFPEQVVFSFKPGRTRDLRPHIYMFALRSNVTWSQKETNVPASAKEYIQVKVKGKLNSQVMAIGGETTGIEISANGAVWELDFGDNTALKKLASRLHGKVVVVTGTLNVVSGVEIKKRWIVKATTLRGAAGGAGEKGKVYLDEKGLLRHPLVLREAQFGFVGQTGHLWTIDPNGTWRLQGFVNDQLGKVEKNGKFTPAQLKNLARDLARYDLLGLPNQLGHFAGANPHRFTLTFGKKKSTLTVPPSEPLPKKHDGKKVSSPTERFAALFRLLRRRMQEAKE